MKRLRFGFIGMFLVFIFVLSNVCWADSLYINEAPDQQMTVLLAQAQEQGAIGETATKIGESVKQASSQVVGEGHKLWKQILFPVFDRMIRALPTLAKGVGVFVFFWVLALVAGFLMTKLLNLLKVDEHAKRDLGLEKPFKTPTGKTKSIAKLFGTLTKWVILLFGVIAFLQVLNLHMVADPLRNVLNILGKGFTNVLHALFVFFLYWIVATLVRFAITKVADTLNFDDWVEKYFPSSKMSGKQMGPSVFLGRLCFYIILLFGIPPILQALGQESLVLPLQEMLGKGLGYLPNIASALFLLFIGYVLATIVRGIVTNFLAGVGVDAGADRLGVSKIIEQKKISNIVGMVIYFFIFIPIIVSAVDALGVKAISDPVKDTLQKILAAIPAILLATFIVIVGYIVAKFVRNLVEDFLSGVGFDMLPDKLGLKFLKPKKQGTSLSNILGAVVMVVILLLTAQQALSSLGMEQLSNLVSVLVLWLPKLFAGLVILFAALWIGTYIGNLVAQATEGSMHNQLVSSVAKYAIIFFGASIALNQMGVGRDIVTVGVSSVLGGTALALGLAFGLGGKDKAKAFLEKGSGGSRRK